MTKITDCKCMFRPVEYIDLDENNLIKNHYYECWTCGKIQKINSSGVYMYYEVLTAYENPTKSKEIG